MTLYNMKKDYYEVFKDLEKYKENYSKFGTSLEKALKNRSLSSFLDKVKIQKHHSNSNQLNKIKQNKQYTIKLSSLRNLTGLPISKELDKQPPHYASRLQSSVSKYKRIENEFKGSIFDDDYPSSSSSKKRPSFIPANHKFTIKNDKSKVLARIRGHSPQVGQYSPKYTLIEKRPLVPIMKLNKSPKVPMRKTNPSLDMKQYAQLSPNKGSSTSLLGSRNNQFPREIKQSPFKLHGTYHYQNQSYSKMKDSLEIRKESRSSNPSAKFPEKTKILQKKAIEFSKMIPRNENFFITNSNPTGLNYNPNYNKSKVKQIIFDYNVIKKQKNAKKLCSSYNISSDYKLVNIN